MADVGSTNSGGTSDRMSALTTIIAAALLIAYLVFIVLQWQKASQDATSWSRHQELLNGVEALAFAAAGALFGTTVQRQVTSKAEDRANKAEVQAENNARDAEKGRALQRAIEVRAARPSRERDAVRGGPTSSTEDAFSDLIELAHRYDEGS
jgi:hypothetical protein